MKKNKLDSDVIKQSNRMASEKVFIPKSIKESAFKTDGEKHDTSIMDECYIKGCDPYDENDESSKSNLDRLPFSELVEEMSKYYDSKIYIPKHQKVLKFAEQMQIELDNNSHKGVWEDFLHVPEILNEFDYHYTKLRVDIDASGVNREAVKEHIADCANILMFLGNAYKLYDDE